MKPLLSLDSSSTESDVFYVERSAEEGSPARKKTPVVLNSTQLSEAIAMETIAISPVASLEPQIVTIESDSNEPTFPYGFGSQHPIVPPSLNDLNLPPNPVNVLATMAVIRADQEYSPQSPEPSIPSPNSTPPHECEYHWRLRDNAHNNGRCHILYWRWDQTILLGYFFEWHLWLQWAKKYIYRFEPFLHVAESTKTKKEAEHGNFISQKRGVSQHTWEAHGQPLPAKKTPWRPGTTEALHTFNQTLTITITCTFNCCAYKRICIEYVSLPLHIYMGT